MITITFGAILLVAMTIALVNWRHGWIAAIVCGVLQDPARKLTPGTPAALTMSVVAVYIIIIFAAIGTLQRNRQDFSRRFPRIYALVLPAVGEPPARAKAVIRRLEHVVAGW